MSTQQKPATNPRHDYALAVTLDAILDTMHIDRSLEAEQGGKFDCYCDQTDKVGGICYCCSVDSPESLKF